MRLKDQTALVTGASRGIGRAVAVALAAEGAYILVNYQNSIDSANETLTQIQSLGGDGMLYKADISKVDEVESMVQHLKQHRGRIDILVNNAGITRDKLIMRMSEEDWDSVLDTNLKGAFLSCRAVAPMMIKQRSGAIVNIGSVIGAMGGAGQANYSAAKAGIEGFTRSLARELGSRNVRVNAIAPGFIETDMTDVLKLDMREAIQKQIPLGRFGKPEDIANAVVYLCSDAGSYLHGTVLTIDGGLSM